MKLFLERLGETIKNQIVLLLIVLIISIPIIIVAGIVVFLIIYIPLITLQKYIGDWSALWGLVLFIGIWISLEFKSIKQWVHWQFIEPFKK